MEMREVISLLQEKIKMRSSEISRMEKEVAIAKSVLHNDIRALTEIIRTHYPSVIEQNHLSSGE